MCGMVASGNIGVVAERQDPRLGEVILEQVSWPENISFLAPLFSFAICLVDLNFFR